MSHHDSHSLILATVQNVEKERLARAVCSLGDGSYHVQLHRHDGSYVCGTVKNSKGTEYAVTIGEGYLRCNCPDFSYHRNAACKHLLMLRLRVLQTEGIAEEPE